MKLYPYAKKLVEKGEKEIIQSSQSHTKEILDKLEHLEEDVHELKGEEDTPPPTDIKPLL